MHKRLETICYAFLGVASYAYQNADSIHGAPFKCIESGLSPIVLAQ